MKLFWITTALALASDVVTKWLTAQYLNGFVRLGSLLHLRRTHNTGMALGLFSDQALAGLLFPLTAIFCGWLLIRRYRLTRFTSLASGLVLGGFMGNYAQRLLQGAVLDMIYFPWMPWFVCNVADICICFGVALLAFSLLFRPQDWQEKTRSTEDA